MYTYIRMSTMKPNYFWIQIWLYQIFLIILARLFFLLRPDFALSLPCWLSQFSWDSQQSRDVATSGRNKNAFFIKPILFLYYEKSLLSSNLNSKLFSFHRVKPNLHTYMDLLYLWHGFNIPIFTKVSWCYVQASVGCKNP